MLLASCVLQASGGGFSIRWFVKPGVKARLHPYLGRAAILAEVGTRAAILLPLKECLLKGQGSVDQNVLCWLHVTQKLVTSEPPLCKLHAQCLYVYIGTGMPLWATIWTVGKHGFSGPVRIAGRSYQMLQTATVLVPGRGKLLSCICWSKSSAISRQIMEDRCCCNANGQ